VVEQRPFKPFRALQQQVTEAVKARHSKQMRRILHDPSGPILSVFANPSDPRSDTGIVETALAAIRSN
jgi:hypothetical protein